MKLFLRYYLFLLMAFSAVGASGQTLVIQFNPAIHGQTLDGLRFIQLTNSYPESILVKVTIKVREARAGNVLILNLSSYYLKQGNSLLDPTAFSSGRLAFGNNSHGEMLRQSGRFAEGEYEFCIEVDLSEAKTPNVVPFFENCFVQEIQPLTPLLLLSPVDEDQDCNKRPTFVWQPPVPMPPNAMFAFTLAEVKEKQDIGEAIAFNKPIIYQANIPVNQLLFPFNAPELQEGKTYAWQVIIYSGVTLIKRSEIWTYTVKCEDEKPTISGGSYRELKEGSDGNFYIADKILRFSFHNSFSAGQLEYNIEKLSGERETIKNLPKLPMLAGLNKYDIDLTTLREFKKGNEYLLTVRMINGKQFKLRFIYKNE